MLRKRRVLTIVLVLTIVAIVGAMVLSACQIKLNNPPEDNDNVDTPKDEQGTTQEPEQDTTQHPEQDTTQHPEQDADTTPDVTPDPKPPIVEQKTEAEYKAMFEAELPGVIENCFNKNVINEKFKLKDIKVLAYNNLSGTFYINCDRNNTKSFYEVSNDNLKNQTSYKTLYEEIQNENLVLNFGEQKTSQEEGLANEIAEFAFEQAEVVNYLAENGLNASDLKVLNVTEFQNINGYMTTNITTKTNNKIFNVSLAGRTLAGLSQEEHLNEFKNGYLDNVEIGDAIEYKQLTVA